MRIAIDARAAAEVPAGRGRYVRELLKGFSGIDADHEYLLYAREPWSTDQLDPRFSWRAFGAPGLAWPLLAGRKMSGSADVGLACTSYAITAPWRIPGGAIIYDFAPFRSDPPPPPGSRFERITLPIAIRRCQALIAISETTRQELIERYPGSAAKTTVAYPAADSAFSPVDEAADAATLRRHGLQPPYVLATGTLEPRKNLPRLIEAFAGLDPRLRSGWTLALAGAAGWDTDATFSSVAEHAEMVHALGYVPDDELACLYRHAEVFCYVSMYEGFGIPVLEGMRSGTAVLTSSVSSMPEVAGDAAHYVDPLDVQSIRSALGDLLGDEDLRRRYGAAGIERAKQFDWPTTARHVLETLEGLVG